jgi:mRNA interferase MazF
VAKYVPKRGDFIIANFDPQSGHEQKGRRPALVVSKDLFNRITGMAIVCPITNTDKRHPLHVAVPSNSSLTGFVMVEQVKALDYGSRGAHFVERAPVELINEVLAVLDSCLYDSQT